MFFFPTNLYVSSNIRTMTPCDRTIIYHKWVPCANVFSEEEVLLFSVLFSWRKPTPVHYASVSGMLFNYTPMRLPLSLDLGESICLCIFKYRREMLPDTQRILAAV